MFLPRGAAEIDFSLERQRVQAACVLHARNTHAGFPHIYTPRHTHPSTRQAGGKPIDERGPKARVAAAKDPVRELRASPRALPGGQRRAQVWIRVRVKVKVGARVRARIRVLRSASLGLRLGVRLRLRSGSGSGSVVRIRVRARARVRVRVLPRSPRPPARCQSHPG